jgi:putative ABC transport system permease protein
MLHAVVKSLLSRKLRLFLSGLAVVLGVMFVAGSLVLTTSLGNSFQALFATAYQNVDVQITAKPEKGAQNQGGPAIAGSRGVPASLVDKVKAVDGVKSVRPQVFVNGAEAVGHNRKVVPSSTGQQYGTNWTGTSNVLQLRQGHGPTAPDEIAINAGLAKAGDFKVGERVGVLTPLQRTITKYTVVGIYGYSGDRDSLGGETSMSFTTPVAQQVMLGQKDAYTDISVQGADGVSQATLKDRMRQALGSSYQVQTGKELAKQSSDSIKSALNFFNYVLLGFAGVALFVGMFLILNTFSIIVAQRTRELALMRAIGASRNQMIGSVLLEAGVIGLLAGAVGLVAGIGVGALLGFLFTNIGGGNLQLSVGVPASAVIASFAVGIVVTVLAALFPSLRASRVPPVAAMREAATPDRPLTRLTIFGGAVFAIGAVTLGVGLFGSLSGTATLWAILAGVLVAFVGVALLTPVIARPVVAVIGRLFAWSTSGTLGRRNSGRNPRRTAITAAALMVGIALITGVSTVLSSVQTSANKIVDSQLKADLVVAGQQSSQLAPTFAPSVLTDIEHTDGVAAVAGLYTDFGQYDGKPTNLVAINDPAALQRIFGVKAASGEITHLADDQVLIDDKAATKRHLEVGDRVTFQLARGQQTFTIAGTYDGSSGVGLSGWLLPQSAAARFHTPNPSQAYIQLAPGASVKQVKNRVDKLLADSPEVNVTDRSDYVKQQTSFLNTIQTMIEILLTLAIIIAALGVMNTLALSVIERTRELGLLRAIGMRRGQVLGMITVESVVISVFGALLGLAVGAGLGAAVVRALHDQGIKYLSFSWGLMVTYLVLAAVIGVAAAVLPSIRAARLNVLAAIAYE